MDVGGEGDWAAIKLAERVDALATNRERAGRVNKRSIKHNRALVMEIFLHVVPSGRRRKAETAKMMMEGLPVCPLLRGCLLYGGEQIVVDCTIVSLWRGRFESTHRL